MTTATATHGCLALVSPWARSEFPDYSERRAIEERIPDGLTIRIVPKSDRSAFGVEVMEWGATMSGNRVVTERRYYRAGQALREGIEAAIGWIAQVVPA